MSERQWFFIDGGNQTGPVSETQIKTLLQSGRLPRDTMVWSDNLPAWTPASQVPALSSATGETQWHYVQGNAQAGPVSEAELKQLLAVGQITPQTMVWSAGMAGWSPAAAVPALAGAAPAQAAAAVQTEPAAGTGALTPSEVVLLHADQFVGEGTMLKGGNWTSLTTGAKVGYLELTQTLLTAALLANEQAGAVRLQMQPKKAMLGLKSKNVAMVEYVQDAQWPEGTLEWICVEGMRGQKPREAEDLFTGMLLMDSTYPHTLAGNIAQVGLEKRGLLSTEEKKKLMIISVMNFKVTDQTRAAMAACPPPSVRQLLDQCRQSRPDIFQALAEAAKTALGNRREYND